MKRTPDLTVLTAELRATTAQWLLAEAKSVTGPAKAKSAARREMASLDAKETEIAAAIFAHPLTSLRDVQSLLYFVEDHCSDALRSDTYLSGAFEALMRGVCKLATNEARG